VIAALVAFVHTFLTLWLSSGWNNNNRNKWEPAFPKGVTMHAKARSLMHKQNREKNVGGSWEGRQNIKKSIVFAIAAF